MINTRTPNNNLFCPKDIVPRVSWPDELAQLHPFLLLRPLKISKVWGFTCVMIQGRKSTKKEHRLGVFVQSLRDKPMEHNTTLSPTHLKTSLPLRHIHRSSAGLNPFLALQTNALTLTNNDLKLANFKIHFSTSTFPIP